MCSLFLFCPDKKNEHIQLLRHLISKDRLYYTPQMEVGVFRFTACGRKIHDIQASQDKQERKKQHTLYHLNPTLPLSVLPLPLLG